MNDDDYLELTRAELDARWATKARCNRCGRTTSSADDVGTVDKMTQPYGGTCGGRFEQ